MNMLTLIKSWGIFMLLISYALVAQASTDVDVLTDKFLLPDFQQTIFVDSSLKQSCDTYHPQTRRCQKGAFKALKTLNQATQTAKPGDLFMIREGDYKEVLHITQSGTAEAYIGFIAFNAEQVRLTNINSIDNGEVYGPIWLDQSSYNLISGIDVTGSVGFGRLLNAHHNIIDNGEFIESTFWRDGRGASKRGGLYVAFSHFNKITNNYFYKGTDSLSLVHSDHNLIENNEMTLAGHDLWNIKCGSFNVVRGNEFSNKNQKLGAVFDCEKGTMSWHGNGQFAQQKVVLDRTKNNVIEGNIFRDASHYYSTSGGNGIQYAGQQGIIRFNRFYRTNAGFSLASYKEEAMYNYDNRIYNNTFHDNWCVGIAIGKERKKLQDNEFVNNILWNNQGLSSEKCSDESAKQILFKKESLENSFLNNNIASSKGDQVIGVWGRRGSYAIDDPASFEDNIALDPQFVDEANNNYQLRKNSPMIDKGAFVSTIVSDSGAGKEITVEDAKFFFDGYAISGVQGDLIQIQGQQQTARILAIDYQHNVLTLDKMITWSEGDLLSLAYQGEAPDIGALEFTD